MTTTEIRHSLIKHAAKLTGRKETSFVEGDYDKSHALLKLQDSVIGEILLKHQGDAVYDKSCCILLGADSTQALSAVSGGRYSHVYLLYTHEWRNTLRHQKTIGQDSLLTRLATFMLDHQPYTCKNYTIADYDGFLSELSYGAVEHKGPIHLVVSKNAIISLPMRDVGNFLVRIYLHNLAQGVNQPPVLLRQLPIPEELPSLSFENSFGVLNLKKYLLPDPLGDCRKAPALGYKICRTPADKERVIFSPYDVDNAAHTEYHYVENLAGWQEQEERVVAFVSPCGEAAVVSEEIARCGVMVLFRTTITFMIDTVTSLHERQRLITLLVPSPGLASFSFLTVERGMLDAALQLFSGKVDPAGMTPDDFRACLRDRTLYSDFAATVRARSFVVSNMGGTTALDEETHIIWQAGLAAVFYMSNAISRVGSSPTYWDTLISMVETMFGEMKDEQRAKFLYASRLTDYAPFGKEKIVRIHNTKMCKLIEQPRTGCFTRWYAQRYHVNTTAAFLLSSVVTSNAFTLADSLKAHGHNAVANSANEFWQITACKPSFPADAYVIDYSEHVHLVDTKFTFVDPPPEFAPSGYPLLKELQPVQQEASDEGFFEFGPAFAPTHGDRTEFNGPYKNGIIVSAILDGMLNHDMHHLAYAGCGTHGITHTIADMNSRSPGLSCSFIDPVLKPSDNTLLLERRNSDGRTAYYEDYSAYMEGRIERATQRTVLQQYPVLPFTMDYVGGHVVAAGLFEGDGTVYSAAAKVRHFIKFFEENGIRGFNPYDVLIKIEFEYLDMVDEPVAGFTVEGGNLLFAIAVGKKCMRFRATKESFEASNWALYRYECIVNNLKNCVGFVGKGVRESEDSFRERAANILRGIGHKPVLVEDVGTEIKAEILFSDACTLDKDLFDGAAVMNFEYVFFKWRISHGGKRYAVLPTGWRLLYKPTASTTEYCITNIPPGWHLALDLLDVAADGFPFKVMYDRNGAKRLVIDKHKLLEHSRMSHVHDPCTQSSMCCTHTVASMAGGHMAHFTATHFTHKDATTVAPTVRSFFGTVAAETAERNYYATPNRYTAHPNVRFLEFYEDAYSFLRTKKPHDKEEEEFLKSIKQGSYTVQVRDDPLAVLLNRHDMIVLDASAGSGKTTLLGSVGHSVFSIAPTAPIASASKGKFRISLTFQVALAELICKLGTGRLDGIRYILLDEMQFFGPMIYIFAQLCCNYRLKLVMAGELFQQPWMNVITGDYKDELARLVEVNHLERLPRNVSRTSYRFDQHTANILSYVVGHKITGLGRGRLRFNFGGNLEGTLGYLAAEITSGRLLSTTTIIVLNHDTEQAVLTALPGVSKNVITATVATGLDFVGTEKCIFIAHTVGTAPYKISVGGRDVDTAVYVALSRGNVLCYCPDGFLGLSPECISSFDIAQGPYTTAGKVEYSDWSDLKPILGLIKPISVDPAFESVIPAQYAKSTNPDSVAEVHIGEKKPRGRRVRYVNRAVFSKYDLWKKIQSSRDFDTQATSAQLVDVLSVSYDEESFAMQRIKYGGVDHFNKLQARPPVGKPADVITYVRQGHLTAVHTGQISTDFGMKSSVDQTGRFGKFSGLLSFDGHTEATVIMHGPAASMKRTEYMFDSIPTVGHTVSTGQLHEVHVLAADDLMGKYYDTVPIQDRTLMHGQAANIVKKWVNCSSTVATNTDVLFKEEKAQKKLLFARGNYSALHHHYSTVANLAAALSRYGPKCFELRVAEMGFAGVAYMEKAQQLIDFALGVIERKCRKSKLTGEEFRRRVEMHKIAYLTDQSNKAVYVESTEKDLFRAAYYLQQATKMQEKHPSNMKKGSATGDKCQQPVVSSTAGHMESIAGRMRCMTEAIMDTFGPKIGMSGANWSMGCSYEKLRTEINWSRVIGVDIRECDSSHMNIFIDRVRAFAKVMLPLVYVEDVDEVFDYIKHVMSEWYTRARDGSVKARVFGQLASGLAWTFFWNCLWSMVNIIITLVSTLGAEFFAQVEDSLVLYTAGDDGFFSWHGNVVLPTELQEPEFVNELGVGLKIERAKHCVEVCHYTWTPNGFYVDAMRLLGKVMTRMYDQENTAEQIKEYQQAVFVNIKHMLIPEYRSLAVDALSRTHDQHPADLHLAIETLHRFCNTPPQKLVRLLNELVVLRVIF